MIDSKRLFFYKNNKVNSYGPVVYWMSRDQRIHDNWALLYALVQANDMGVPIHIIFALSPKFPGSNFRHYNFLLKGLEEVAHQAALAGIGFEILKGEPDITIPQFIKKSSASLLVSDFDPLRVKQRWKEDINNSIDVAHVEVDTHNVVPCRIASQKVEFAAYTIRPKINKLLPQFLTDFPSLPIVKVKSQPEPINWDDLLKWLNPDYTVEPIDWLLPGYTNGTKALNDFIVNKLNGYSVNRNNPLTNGQSNLSSFLHFGQISAQRVAIEVSRANAPNEDKLAYLEELIVRKELSDNFCFYNPNYDNVNGFHSWALSTLDQHNKDEREYIYTLNEFEQAQTHDTLWNAAQLEMVNTGKMHGYMRMYWAKKILEWTQSPAQAMEFAIFLNDKYSIDGRDPNGYTGIAWSIGGVHDRAWAERPVFGKIRYMNFNGCKRKFNVEGYIELMRS
jgi:deoxyribodipyrimidine photo-lyase